MRTGHGKFQTVHTRKFARYIGRFQWCFSSFWQKAMSMDPDKDMLALPAEVELGGPKMPPAPPCYSDARAPCLEGPFDGRNRGISRPYRQSDPCKGIRIRLAAAKTRLD